jgi:hypothetical protein
MVRVGATGAASRRSRFLAEKLPRSTRPEIDEKRGASMKNACVELL